MKRISFMLLTIALMLGLCACGQSADKRWQEQYDLGVRYLSEGNYEEAIIAFTAAIEIDPKRPESFISRGDAYVAFVDTEENLAAAQADYEAALALDECLAEAWLGLAKVYIVVGNLDQAIEILKTGLGLVAENDRETLMAILDDLASTEDSKILDGETVPISLPQFNASVTDMALNPPLQNTNEGSVGQLSFTFIWDTETIPQDIADRLQTALIATWSAEGFTREEIVKNAVIYEEIWREEGNLWKDYPYSHNAFPVWEEDLGTTTQVLLYALNDQGNIVGYLILPVAIPAM